MDGLSNGKNNTMADTSYLGRTQVSQYNQKLPQNQILIKTDKNKAIKSNYEVNGAFSSKPIPFATGKQDLAQLDSMIYMQNKHGKDKA